MHPGAAGLSARKAWVDPDVMSALRTQGGGFECHRL